MTKHTNVKSTELINAVIKNCKTKNAKRGLKLLSKHADLSFICALPSLVFNAIKDRQFINKETNTLNILIHSSLKYDCVDHYRWMALIPFLIGDLSLRINVVATVDNVESDTQTQFRNVIDSMIAKELNHNFASELVVGSIEDTIEHYGSDYFNIVVNNIPSINDINNQSAIVTIGKLITLGVPYIIGDFTKVTLLNRYTSFQLAGITSSEQLKINPNGVSFTKNTSTKYSHAGHYLIMDEFVDNSPIDLEGIERLKSMEKPMVIRLEHGDPMLTLPTVVEHKIEIFQDVILNTETNIVEAIYQGDKYLVLMPNLPKIPILGAPKSLSDEACLAYWAVNCFALIVNEIENKKRLSA
ncbi:hypothetical protein [Thalassotalea piscium]|uniref:Uncharacterized protein n=1 Tax=Thalassotalea piscium TaxID=1230533 RepID=A0A7X0NGI8_9GAMM|nr:hypothetical protein [Thalassotalea piscium]MBB6543057.1 hypothetical protein [Thalassotalea piscium]